MLVTHPSRSSGCYATGIAVCLATFLFVPEHVWAQKCVGSPLAVQVLGSGGPRINPMRASAGYVLWVDGEARMLVDVGGGTFARFGQSEANFIDLSLVAISHLHPDHVSDLPALLWTSQNLRTAPLPISGPSGNDVVPGFPVFLSRLFDEKVGAFPMLDSTISGRQGAGGGVPLKVGVVDVTKKSPSTVFEHEGFRVTAQGIPHGNIPALAYRVDTRGRSVVFSTDQNGSDPAFIVFAKGADVLVMHLAIAAGTTSLLHASPAVVGQVARDVGAKRLIVSHIGQFPLPEAIAELQKSYSGPVTVAADLQCTLVP